MKPKADTENGWFKVADDLAQALARSRMSAPELIVCLWVLCTTYGRKCRFGKAKGDFAPCKDVRTSIYCISRDTGLDRSATRRAFNKLKANQVLRETRHEYIGFNTNINQWPTLRGREFPMGFNPGGRLPLGRTAQGSNTTIPPGSTSTTPPGGGLPRGYGGIRTKTGSTRTSNARAKCEADVGERAEGGDAGASPRTPSPQGILPNGKADNIRNRIELGHPGFDPAMLPEWDRLNFDLQREWRSNWDDNCNDTYEKKRKAELEEMRRRGDIEP